MAAVFDFRDYRHFLKQLVTENRQQRGFQARLAQAANCQPSYMSQVLTDRAELLLDQAAGLAESFGFSELETEYFLTLVSFARAATQSLKKHLSRRLENLRQLHGKLEKRIESPSRVEEEVEKFYYSSWYWSALHVATSIPQLQTPEALATRFQLPLGKIKDCLKKLESFGFVEKSEDKWQYAGGASHLPSASIMTELNHSHWRQRALLDVQKGEEQSVHYSSVVSMSQEDAQKLREFFLEMITRSRKISDPSPPEELFCIAFDLFRV